MTTGQRWAKIVSNGEERKGSENERTVEDESAYMRKVVLAVG